MQPRRIVLAVIVVASVALAVLWGPSILRWTQERSVWYRGEHLVGSYTYSARTGDLIGTVELWRIDTGEQFATGRFVDGKGEITTLGRSDVTLDMSHWTKENIEPGFDHLRALHEIADGFTSKIPFLPYDPPPRNAPWVLAGRSVDDWWAEVTE